MQQRGGNHPKQPLAPKHQPQIQHGVKAEWETPKYQKRETIQQEIARSERIQEALMEKREKLEEIVAIERRKRADNRISAPVPGEYVKSMIEKTSAAAAEEGPP
eukprot:TRINITY_DN992_c0_g1_i2.p1 TRINITY_DN992_c0_g1~~TRINITY_DN992_c0_g1_i2.p1  ORF type:complete len:104 (-),score=19.88 TRINITY_DN992_c0_g1_i2:165-476(-)